MIDAAPGDLVDWLDQRQPPSPASLRETILEAVRLEDPGTGSGAARLATVALESLASLIHEPPTRAQAIRLLAADALLTYACEAAAEEGGDAVARLARDFDPARFDALLERVAQA
jgi:hypothetical protein